MSKQTPSSGPQLAATLARVSARRSTWATSIVLSVIILGLWLISKDILFFRAIPQNFDAYFRYHIDFDVYREGAKAFLAGDNLYTRGYSVGGVSLPFTYPPFAALVFVPFTLLSVNFGATILCLTSALALWWCVVLATRSVMPEWSKASVYGFAAVILSIALLMEPVRDTMGFAQVNVLLMLLVIIDVLARRTVLPRGSLVGIAAAIKLTPAVFGLYFLVKKDYKAAAWSVASGIGVTLLTWLIAPQTSTTYWFETLSDPGRIGDLTWPSNQSFRGVIARFFGQESHTGLWAAASLLVFAVLAWLMWALLRRDHTAAALCVNSLLALLCSPVSWSHHWVWVVVAVAVAIVVAARSWGASAAAYPLMAGSVWAVVITVCSGHWLLPRYDGAPMRWNLAQHLFGDSYVLMAILVLVAMSVWFIKPWGMAAGKALGNVTYAVAVGWAVVSAYVLFTSYPF